MKQELFINFDQKISLRKWSALVLFAIFLIPSSFSAEKTPLSEDQKEKVYKVSGFDISSASKLGGIMNNNYLVQGKDGKEAVLKVLTLEENPLISRTNEVKNQELCVSLDIAPPIRSFSALGFNFYLVEYIKYARSFNQKIDMDEFAKVLATLHASKFSFNNEYNFTTLLEKGLAILENGKLLRSGYRECIADSIPIYQRVFTSRHIAFSPCHNDLHIENILVLPDGKIKLIDWEFSSRNDPAWDLSFFLTINRISKEQWEPFIMAYIRHFPKPVDNLINLILFYQPYILLNMATLLSYKLEDKKCSRNELIKIIHECLHGACSLFNSESYKEVRLLLEKEIMDK